MRFIHGILFWIKFWLLTVSLFLYLCFAKLFFTITRRPKFDEHTHRTAYWWSRIIIHTTPGWSVTLHGAENIPRDKTPIVLVSNHESMTDIWILFFMDLQFRWLAKAELFKIPVIGPPMRWAGYIAIDRGNKASHNEALTRSAASVHAGVPMLFFPEGTRSDTGEMRPFKIGAFKLASDTRAGILPVALKGARQMIPKGSWLPSPSAVKVQVLPIMYRLEDEDLQDFADRVRAAIMMAYNRL